MSARHGSGVQVGDVIAVLERRYPPATAESFDAVGLVCGDPDAATRRVLFSVDVTPEVVAQARELRVDLVVAHHPLLLRGIHAVDVGHPKGKMLTDLITAGIALYCAHTNADIGPGGTVEALSRALGVQRSRPLRVTQPDSPADGQVGLGRVGELDEAVTLAAFAERVAAAIPDTATGVRVGGDPARMVRTVAVQAGAGDDLLDAARQAGAQVYVTSDLRHHPASEALAWRDGPALIDIAHWAAEWTWLPVVRELVAAELDVETELSTIRTDPWSFVVHPHG